MKALLLLIGLIVASIISFHFIHPVVGVFFAAGTGILGLMLPINFGTEGNTRGQDAGTVRKLIKEVFPNGAPQR